MNEKCEKVKRDLVAFLYGELDDDIREQIRSHLDICPYCQEELQGLKGVVRAADVLNDNVEEAMASVNWDTLPNQISNAVFDDKSVLPRKAPIKSFWEALTQSRFKPVYAALLVGLVLGSLATLIVMRTSLLRESQGGSFIVTQDFLDRLELEMARRDTLDYLEKSQYVLLDFVQSNPEEVPQSWRRDITWQAAKDLLAKKRYINPQLEKFHMAKAKEICDQIEFLFFELTQVSGQLSEGDLQNIQNLIEEKQLLLKIKLLKKDLEESEV
jgi:hypothetical protein